MHRKVGQAETGIRVVTEKTGGAAAATNDGFEDVPRIVRRTLHSEVLNQLRDMIIEGRLAPGARSMKARSAASSASRARLCAKQSRAWSAKAWSKSCRPRAPSCGASPRGT